MMTHTEFALPALSNEMPGLFVGSNQSRSFTDTFSVRGLTNTPIFGAPAVAVYLDNLPLGSSFTFPSDLTGLGRPELLRGPGAGTRFGRSGPGGTILLSTPAPAPRDTISLSFAAGDHGSRTATATFASASDRHSDTYATATCHKRNGYVRNITINQDVDPQETHSALTRFRYRPSTATELTIFLNTLSARVEHPFQIVKNLFGYRKVHYCGLRKNTAQMHTLFALANLILNERKPTW